jgi:hypothetical protein
MSKQPIEQGLQKPLTDPQEAPLKPQKPHLSYFWDDIAPGNPRALPKNHLHEPKAKEQEQIEIKSTAERMTQITT